MLAEATLQADPDARLRLGARRDASRGAFGAPARSLSLGAPRSKDSPRRSDEFSGGWSISRRRPGHARDFFQIFSWCGLATDRASAVARAARPRHPAHLHAAGRADATVKPATGRGSGATRRLPPPREKEPRSATSRPPTSASCARRRSPRGLRGGYREAARPGQLTRPATNSRSCSTPAFSRSSTRSSATARTSSTWTSAARTGGYGVVTGYGTIDGRTRLRLLAGLHGLRRLAR